MVFCLCLIVDIFSRKIVGSEVHARKSADLAAMLNGLDKRFNGRMRDEFPNKTLSRTLGHARERIAPRITDDTTARPHGA